MCVNDDDKLISPLSTFRAIAAAVLAMGLSAAFAQSAPPAAASTVQARVHYPHDIEGLLDITYETIPGYRPLKLDLYHAPGAKGLRPAVVWLHGGGFVVGSPRMADSLFGEWDQVLAKLAARGYVTAGVTYRFSGEARFPAQMEDVKASIRWLRANAAKYGIDPQRIAIWGASAGGYFAVLAGTSCKAEALEGRGGNPDQSSCVQAVVDWYGPTDLAQMDAQAPPDSRIKHNGADSPESKLLGCALPQCPADLMQRANPLTYISAATPPFLIMQGDADTAVPWKQSQVLHDALRAKGVAANFVLEPGLNHMFVGATPAQVQNILATVFEFLDSSLGVKPE
jgi:acetyl esterase/lipase